MFKTEGQKVCLTFIVIILLMVILAKSFPTEYSRKAYVDKIRGDEITFIDGQGNLWNWEREKEEEFNLGEKVILVFDNNMTDDNVTDDIIIQIKQINQD